MKFSPLASADGRLMGALRISYDVTDRLREQRALAARAEELRRANARLRAEMKRREEAQAALLQAQKLEALGQLTSGVAHDFNNVTQAVAFGFEIIEKRANDPRSPRSRARRGGGASRRTTRQADARFRPQAGAGAAGVDLGGSSSETWPLLARTLGPRVESEGRAPRGRPACAGRPRAAGDGAHQPRGERPRRHARRRRARLSRAGEPRGRAAPPARARRPSCDGDLGQRHRSGISPTVLQRVLEPFFTTKGIGKGTGLGLPWCTASRSSPAARSGSKAAKGRGRRSRSICRSRGAGRAHPEPAASTPGAGGPPALTILLVDDDEAVRSLVAAQLEGFGHRVVQADARRRRSPRSRHPIDLVVSDVVMPGEGGPALAAKLRERRPELPVLFITGHADQERLVGERVLEKPFTPEALREALAAAFAAAQIDD